MVSECSLFRSIVDRIDIAIGSPTAVVRYTVQLYLVHRELRYMLICPPTSPLSSFLPFALAFFVAAALALRRPPCILVSLFLAPCLFIK